MLAIFAGMPPPLHRGGLVAPNGGDALAGERLCTTAMGIPQCRDQPGILFDKLDVEAGPGGQHRVFGKKPRPNSGGSFPERCGMSRREQSLLRCIVPGRRLTRTESGADPVKPAGELEGTVPQTWAFP
jgi:hypothetical protein